MKPPNSAAPRVSTHGHLLGFDVSGFTREVQALGAAGGVHGFEMATDRLGNAFGAVVRAGCAAGYLLGDVLGDCLILTKAIGSAKDNADSAASTYAPLFAQESGFAVKAAGCHGAFRTITLPFDLPGGRTVLLGTAVAELHARLEAAEATAPVARSPGAAQRDPALLDRKLGTAVAMRSLAAFCRLGGSVADFPSDENLVHAAALLRHFCLQHGGALQKITHDSKGVVACMTLPVRFGALVDLAAAFEVVHRRLGAVGIEAATSVSAGTIYTGPIDIDGDARMMVHGVAVNAAAKRLSRVGSGVFLDRSAAARLRRQPRPATEVPLLGRDAEVSALARMGDRALAGEVCRVHVEGVAGIGKSRLLRALSDRLGNRFATAAVQCQVEDKSRPWHAAGAITAALVRAVWVRGSHEDSFRAACDAAGLAPEHLPLAADILDIRSPGLETPVPGAWQAEAKQNILTSLLKAAVERGPVALFLDDAQWCDHGTSVFISEGSAPGKGLLIVTAARPAGPAWHQPGIETLRLSPLTKPDSEALCRAILQSDKLPVEAEVLRVGNGNPLLLTQMASAMRGRPEATPAGGTRRRPRSQAFAAVLERRLSALPESQLAALRFLSAAKIALPAPDAAGLLARGHVRFAEAALDDLVAQGLAIVGEDRSYQVSHQLVAAAVLKATPAGATVRLNEHIARYAERGTLGRRLPPAQHAAYWMHAKRPERAAVKFGLAADRVLSVGGYREAIDLFERAENQLAGARVEPACRARRQMEWSVKKAQAHWGRGEITAASSCLQHAFALYAEVTGAGAGWTAQIKSGLGYLSGSGDREFREAGNRVRRAFLLAHSIRSELAQFTGEVGPLVRSSFASALLARGTVDGYVGEARAYAMFSYVLGLARIGPLRTALLGYAGRRLAAAPRSHPRAYVAASEAVYHMIYGRWADARRHLHAARSWNRGPVELHLAEVVLTLEALTDHFSGDPALAAERFRQLGVRARARGNVLHTAWGDYGRAQALLADGEAAAAAPLLDDAARMLEGSGDIQSRLIVAGLKAGFANRCGDAGSAVALALSAFDLARTVPPTNLSSLEGYAQPAEIFVGALANPDLSPALAAAASLNAEPAVRLLEKFGLILPIGRPRANLVRAMLLRVRGRHGPAEKKAAAARRLADRYSMALDASAIEREFPLRLSDLGERQWI